MNLRLLGAPTLADVTPEMVSRRDRCLSCDSGQCAPKSRECSADFLFASQIDASNLTSRQVDSAPDYLARANYEPLAGVGNGLGAQPRLISKETKASL